MMYYPSAPDDTGYTDKSRSQKKRESTAVQRTGTALAALSVSDLEALDLPSALVEAIATWRQFPSREAKRRQMQYIGRIMRDMDLAGIEEKLQAHLAPSRAAIQGLHAVEALRDRLVTAEGDELERELAALAARHPGLPLARLRHLSETARSERAGKKPPKASRELFRILRDMLAQAESER